MSATEFASITLRLPFATAKEITHQCEKEFLLARHVIARSFGQPFEEPIIFKIPGQDKWYLPKYKDFSELLKRKPEFRGQPDQKTVYLSILSQIVKAMPIKFAAHALSLHGTKRSYFGNSREEVEHTGKNNEAANIPETVWWASVNNDKYKKQTTLEKLMRRLGFSDGYTNIISWAPYHKFPMYIGIEFEPD